MKTIASADADVIAAKNEWIAYEGVLDAWKDGSVAEPADDAGRGNAVFDPQAHAFRRAMSAKVTTLAGVHAQMELLLVYQQRYGESCVTDWQDIAPLDNMLRVLREGRAVT